MKENEIDILKLRVDEVTHWCPEEVIVKLRAEIKKEKYVKPKINKDSGAWIPFFFVVLKNGQCGMVSSLNLNAWALKNVYEGKLETVQPPTKPNFDEVQKKAIREFVMNYKA